LYDIVFISYNESNAEENWALLKSKMPKAMRLHGIKGLHAAHATAAAMVSTDMFYVVDGDAEIANDFEFDHIVTPDKKQCVHVFRAKNPVNNLVYGYGAVKLLPTGDVLSLMNSEFKPDVTTSINRRYEVIHKISNITRFNTSEFNTWRSAFRECAKLSSKIIPEQVDRETEHRLDVWCNVGADSLYGDWSILGAQAGKNFGRTYKEDNRRLMMINDMNVMRQLYDRYKV